MTLTAVLDWADHISLTAGLVVNLILLWRISRDQQG